MTPLDQALEAAKTSQCKRNAFYGLLVSSTLYVPTHDTETDKPETFNPILAEAEGITYLMVFDTEEKLSAWAQTPMTFAPLPGHALIEITTGNIHWALNPGTDHAKILQPDEIAWLKDLVVKFKKDAGDEATQ
tara:strand:+ start:2713 stop:3111 length:399 start_codon:yes stop_codon:yes gene_type:complete